MNGQPWRSTGSKNICWRMIICPFKPGESVYNVCGYVSVCVYVCVCVWDSLFPSSQTAVLCPRLQQCVRFPQSDNRGSTGVSVTPFLCLNRRMRWIHTQSRWMQSRDRGSPLVSFFHYGGAVSRADGLSLPHRCLFCVLREGFLLFTFSNAPLVSCRLEDTHIYRRSHGRPRRGFVRPAKRG